MQLFLMPTLVPALGEAKLLSVGLLFSCAHVSPLSLCNNFLACYNGLSIRTSVKVDCYPLIAKVHCSTLVCSHLRNL